MIYALIVIAIFCLILTALLASLIRLKNFWLLVLLDFIVTFAVLFSVAESVSEWRATTAEAFGAAFGIAGGLALLLMAVRLLDRRVFEPRLLRRKRREREAQGRQGRPPVLQH